MKLACYVYSGWKPRIRAASQTRGWMDATPERFAYSCLPLDIANSHGWEILSPVGFEAEWNGGSAPEDVLIRPDPGYAQEVLPVALFGAGDLTFHVEGLFRTEPGRLNRTSVRSRKRRSSRHNSRAGALWFGKHLKAREALGALFGAALHTKALHDSPLEPTRRPCGPI